METYTAKGNITCLGFFSGNETPGLRDHSGARRGLHLDWTLPSVPSALVSPEHQGVENGRVLGAEQIIHECLLIKQTVKKKKKNKQ